MRKLFPSSAGLNLQWHSIVKIAQSLYREAPGMDPFRPDQRTPIPNFFLAGSYTKQDYIDRWASTGGRAVGGRGGGGGRKLCRRGRAAGLYW